MSRWFDGPAAIFLILLLLRHQRGKVEGGKVEDRFEKCCALGSSWAKEGLRCEKFSGPVSGVPRLEQGLCLEAVDICCVRAYREQQCDKGKSNARAGMACVPASGSVSPASRRMSDYQRDCCEGCKLGILTGSLGQGCALKSFSFGDPWDPAFLECCREALPTTTDAATAADADATSGEVTTSTIPTPKLDDICQLMKGLLCSDICVATPGSYYCACSEGFTLLDDGKSCRRKEDELDNDLASACPPGYRYNRKKNVCDDVDECAERRDICGEEICYNQPGGYSCSKRPSPMTRRPTTATTTATTTAAMPASNEKCAPGTRYVRNRGCVDIDECRERPDACTSDEHCLNTMGSYSCGCKTGFRRDNLTRACVDINECQLENNCLPTQRCDNTVGSYTCVRFLPCGTGYTLNAATELCEDDDECLLGTHDCGEGYHCRNTLGSYRCDRNHPRPQPSSRSSSTSSTLDSASSSPFSAPTPSTEPSATESSGAPTTSAVSSKAPTYCPRGFEAGGPAARCNDIDECQRDPTVCRRRERCVNTIGSYRCVSRVICSSGYTALDDPFNGQHCVDVDECAEGTHRCQPEQICENRQGGYVCKCPQGHVQGPGGERCIDVDECSIYGDEICGAKGHCENTAGSYRCSCEDGFERVANVCRDIDECRRGPPGTLCQHDCFNFWGGYRCGCKPGFRLNSDNRSCTDVDECTEFKDNNLCIGFCENTAGSYSCSCPSGYNLGTDGRTCQDIDECASGQACSDPSEMCQNTRGSFRCNRIDCPPGYYADPTRKNRCVLQSRFCAGGDLACFRRPSHYSYNFITFVSNLPLPPSGQLELFTMRGTHLPGSTVQFSMALVEARAPPGVRRATESCFALRRPSPSQAVLVISQSLPGPQEIELDLRMEIYHNEYFAGSAVAKLFIYVSQYEF